MPQLCLPDLSEGRHPLKDLKPKYRQHHGTGQRLLLLQDFSLLRRHVPFYARPCHDVGDAWVLDFLAGVVPQIGLKDKVAALGQETGMTLLDEAIESCLELTHRVLTLPPACKHVLDDLLLSWIVKLHLQDSSLFLHQHTLI